MKLRAVLVAGGFLLGCASEGEGFDEGSSSSALETPTIVFASDFSERTTGVLSAGAAIRVSYDPARLPQCRGESNNRAAWAITAFYRVNAGAVQNVAVTNAQGASAPATINLPAAPGAIELWFQVSNRWGCNAFDSDYGNNYRFTLAPPANAPGWVGNGAVVTSRNTCNGGIACDADRRPITTPWRYDTGTRQRAAIRVVTFDVWKSGVTDRDNPDLWRQLDVRMYSRLVGAQGAFAMRHVNFARRVGNDARYELDLRGVDPLPDSPTRQDCPDGTVTRSADGGLVEVGFEYYFTVNGSEYRPASGNTFRATFANYPTSLPSRCPVR